MSDTPLTDAQCFTVEGLDTQTDAVAADFARELERENARLREALQWFCDRVERGEVRSKRSYAKFRELLRDTEGK